MVLPTLREFANERLVRGIMVSELAKMFGIEKTGNIPHSFLDSGWEVGGYLNNLAHQLARKIEDKGIELMTGKVKKFHVAGTKLPPEVMDELWMEISAFLSEQNADAAANGDFPAMEDNIRGGHFLPEGVATHHGLVAEDYEEGRKALLARLPQANDKIEFLRRLKNSLFEHYQSKFGVMRERAAAETRPERPGRK